MCVQILLIVIIYELFIIGICINDVTRTFKRWKKRSGQDVKLLLDNMQEEEVELLLDNMEQEEDV